jgi:protein SCO1
MIMSKKAIFYTVFFVGLTFVFYLAVRKWLKPNDTISVVRPFSFTDQDGNTFSDRQTEGKVYVAEFFFTNCPGICPTLNENMKQVYKKFRNEEDFLILSFTSDPERDSAAQLNKYARSLDVDTHKWVFLTGRKDSLYTLARTSYTIDDPANNLKNIKDDFLHTQFWALVNKRGEVKKIYDGLKQSEIEAMMRKIQKLLKE